MKTVVLEMIVEESRQNENSRMLSEITRVNPSLMTVVLSESNYYYNTLILTYRIYSSISRMRV